MQLHTHTHTLRHLLEHAHQAHYERINSKRLLAAPAEPSITHGVGSASVAIEHDTFATGPTRGMWGIVGDRNEVEAGTDGTSGNRGLLCLALRDTERWRADTED